MTTIPGAVLSEHFQSRMEGRRLISAVFTTFKLEPAFFEEEVLPVFFDLGLSQAPKIRIVQLADALTHLPGRIAVYYDRHGLVPEGGSAKLDVQRVPVTPTNSAIFHPKNVFLLVESLVPDDAGYRARTMICACMSANLTRAGWWENVEVAHVEEIPEGAHTNLREPLLQYLGALERLASGGRAPKDLGDPHPAIRDLREHLTTTKQREHRSVDGRLRTQFHDGSVSLVTFLKTATGAALEGMCLEIISPFFDGGADSEPLEELMSTFHPREVRVFLPRSASDEGECPEALYDTVHALPNVSWSSLPEDILRLSKQENARRRRVHAKVYRFFEPGRGGREILYVGSANLTRPGFAATRAGNWESGFVVEATTKERPDWWLGASTRRPLAFAAPQDEAEGRATSGGTPLIMRYRWDAHQAAVMWTGGRVSASLTVLHGNVPILTLTSLAPERWVDLDVEMSARVEKSLVASSIFEVRAEGSEPGFLLVQEEGMHARPSLIHELSAAEILRYWALMTPEQRAAFVDARLRVMGDEVDPLTTALPPLEDKDTLFDRFAGIFHAFTCLEEQVRDALDAKQYRIPDYRIFGRKYDSLGSLLDRVVADVEAGKGDRVDHYVTLQCARQLMQSLRKHDRQEHRAYWDSRADAIAEVEAQLGRGNAIRASLAGSGADMPAFLAWFDDWFLRRAEALPEEGA